MKIGFMNECLHYFYNTFILQPKSRHEMANKSCDNHMNKCAYYQMFDLLTLAHVSGAEG